MVPKVCIFILVIVYPSISSAQVDGIFNFVDVVKSERCFQAEGPIDSLSAFKKFTQCLNNLYGQGFLEARIDSIVFHKRVYVAFGYRGEKYHLASIKPDSLSAIWFQRAGVKFPKLNGKLLNPKSVGQGVLRLLGYLECNGYPFASVDINRTSVSNNYLDARVSVQPGPFIRLDTLYILGDAKISRQFVESHLGFQKYEIYNESAVAIYNRLIDELPFIKTIKPVEVEFIPGKARIYTYLSNRKASQFSGVLGFVSDLNSSSSLKLTGDVNLRLSNVFRAGELNTIQWQSLEKGVQKLNVASTWDYFLGTNMGLSTQFALYRRDSSYVNINPKFEIRFAFPKVMASMGVDYRSTKATNYSAESSSTILYTAAIGTKRKNLEVFTKRGFIGNASVGIGQREATIAEDLSSGRSTIGEFGADFIVMRPLFKEYIVIKALAKGYLLKNFAIHSSSTFFNSEQYRIGGYGSIRGFNQESIVTSAYALASIEAQFRVEQQIILYLFYDQGLVDLPNNQSFSHSNLIGVGAGIDISTKGGVLSLAYALGQGMGQDIQLKNSKLHIGLTTKF